MEKHAVNLIIKNTSESSIIAKLRIFLPIAATVSLALFVVSFFASLIYINNNNREFTILQKEISTLEKNISDKKNIEGIYTLSLLRIKAIDQLRDGSKNFSKFLSEILKFNSNGVAISQASIDKKNAVSISIVASSSATLDNFVTSLVKAESDKFFSDIKSSGIVRDKTGAYLLTISLKPNETLLK